MRKSIVIITLLLVTNISYSQVEIGIKGGLNSLDLITNSISFDGPNGDAFELAYKDSQYGHHIGLYARIKILGFFLEPGAMFNSNSINYELSHYTEGSIIKVVKNERYQTLDVPLMAGIKAGVIRLYAGPVAHLHLNSRSELIDINGYSQRFQDASYGYQAGFGLNVFNLRFDVAYEGNLSKFGDHIRINDIPYEFSESASRLLASVSYAF